MAGFSVSEDGVVVDNRLSEEPTATVNVFTASGQEVFTDVISNPLTAGGLLDIRWIGGGVVFAPGAWNSFQWDVEVPGGEH